MRIVFAILIFIGTFCVAAWYGRFGLGISGLMAGMTTALYLSKK